MRIINVTWERDSASITNRDELYQLNDYLSKIASVHKYGFIAEFSDLEGNVLDVAYGRRYSLATFYSEKTGSFTSKGDQNVTLTIEENDDQDQDSVVFMYHGSWSQFPRNYLLNFSDVVKLTDDFMHSGNLSSSIEWNKL